ncbi:MAG: hypothetical protein KIT22_16315 [Verrucomicrobiae bacterium]|nr:hypothetical protein [Verrucomicrobiae bacterium]
MNNQQSDPMRKETNSILKQSALGCVLTVMLLHSAGRLYAQARVGIDKPTADSSGGAQVTATPAEQNDITGTWKFSIRYTGPDDRATDAPRRTSGPAKGKAVSSEAVAARNGAGWITAQFTSFRITHPLRDSLTLMLKQDGEKVTGTLSGLGDLQKVSGDVKGKEVLLSVAMTNNDGEQITARFTGEVPSSGKMEGTFTFDPKGLFNITGKSPKRVSPAGQE